MNPSFFQNNLQGESNQQLDQFEPIEYPNSYENYLQKLQILNKQFQLRNQTNLSFFQVQDRYGLTTQEKRKCEQNSFINQFEQTERDFQIRLGNFEQQLQPNFFRQQTPWQITYIQTMIQQTQHLLHQLIEEYKLKVEDEWNSILKKICVNNLYPKPPILQTKLQQQQFFTKQGEFAINQQPQNVQGNKSISDFKNINTKSIFD